MRYEVMRELLECRRQDLRYFTVHFWHQFLRDYQMAIWVFENDGDVQEFWETSETHKSAFYNKNSGAYCEMLEIMAW